MPSIKKSEVAQPVEAPYQIKQDVLEELIPGPLAVGDLESIFRQIKKSLLERALNAELTHHLWYAKGETPDEAAGNHRNGTSAKTVLTDDGRASAAPA